MSANIVYVRPNPENVSPHQPTIFSSNWYNHKVEWLKNEKVFKVNLSECTEGELTAGEVEVNVMIGRDPTGADKAENEKWAFVKVKFPKPSSPKPLQIRAHQVQEDEVEGAPTNPVSVEKRPAESKQGTQSKVNKKTLPNLHITLRLRKQ